MSQRSRRLETLTPAEFGRAVAEEQTSAAIRETAQAAFDAATVALVRSPRGQMFSHQQRFDHAEALFAAAHEKWEAASRELRRMLLAIVDGPGASRQLKLLNAWEQTVAARDAHRAGSLEFRQLDAAATVLATHFDGRDGADGPADTARTIVERSPAQTRVERVNGRQTSHDERPRQAAERARGS